MVWVAQGLDGGEQSLRFAAVDDQGRATVSEMEIATVDPNGGWIQALVGSTTGGERLVIWWTQSAVNEPHGRWLSAVGAASGPFSLEGLVDAAIPTSTIPDVLVPLADGTLALRVDGIWRGTIAPGDHGLKPVPSWLQGADNLELTPVAGRRGATPSIRRASPWERARPW